MLSGEGNENGQQTNKQTTKKHTIGLISKKATCTCSTIFFVHFVTVVLHDC